MSDTGTAGESKTQTPCSDATDEIILALTTLKRLGISKGGFPFSDKRGPNGLRRSELMLLFTIRHIVHEYPEGVSVTELSHRLCVRPPTVTRMLDALERNGYIERSADPHDRRMVRIRILDAGEELARKGTAHYVSSINDLVNYLGEEKSHTLAGLIDDICSYFSQKCGACKR